MNHRRGNSTAWILLGVSMLTGCYSPNQSAFEAKVQKQVEPGMPLVEAVSNLGRLKLGCRGDNPVVCDRFRQRLLPSTCVERVRLKVSRPNDKVESVEVDPIICAGL